MNENLVPAFELKEEQMQNMKDNYKQYCNEYTIRKQIHISFEYTMWFIIIVTISVTHSSPRSCAMIVALVELALS